MRCEAKILTGPRRGEQCRNRAVAIIVHDSIEQGAVVCGTHTRAWLPQALARIAYWNPKQRAWL